MKRVNIRSVKQGTGELVELYLENGQTGGRLLCPQNLIPSPGQYVLADDPAADSPLPAPIFNGGSIPGGFLIAPPIPFTWRPGSSLNLRGPLGIGFSMPESARCVALAALANTFGRLKPLLTVALDQSASVVMVSDLDSSHLPPEVEIQPLSAIAEVARWADYLAMDISREALPGLREMLGFSKQARIKRDAQALVLTPMPCGGMGECGVCTVKVRRNWKMACKAGPVFDLNELI